MSNQATRIKERRKGLGLTQSELALRVGVSRVAISHWENDPSVQLTASNLDRLCKALQSSTGWILHGRHEKVTDSAKIIPIKNAGDSRLMEPLRNYEASAGSNSADYRLPILPVTPSAGNGAVVFDEAATAFMEVPKQFLRDLGIEPSRHLRIVSIRGDSMKGTVDHGDLAVIDTSFREMTDDGVYVFTLEGHVLFKRLQRLPGQKLRVISDNDAYPHYEIDETNEIIICAKFLGRWSFTRM